MTVTTNLAVDEPIIFVTIEGSVDDTQIDAMRHEIATLCAQIGICFLVFDVRHAHPPIDQPIASWQSDSISPGAEQPHAVVIGNPVPSATSEKPSIPHFPDKDAALTYVRQQIAALGTGDTS